MAAKGIYYAAVFDFWTFPLMRISKRDIRILLFLAIPLVLTGLVESSLGFISTIFLAHLGVKYLAAGSLVSWFFATLMVILWGLFMGVSVLVSHKHGAKDDRAIALILRDSLWLSILLVIPLTVIIWNLSPVLQLLGQKAAVVHYAVPYMHALAWSVLPDFSGIVLMQFMIGLGQTRTNLIFTLSWVPLNIFLNWCFIFGHFGSPAFGIAGLGWGTALSYWITTIGLLLYFYARPYYRKYLWALKVFTKPQFIWELVKVGLPMGLMWFFEVGFFFTITLIMGHHGANVLAANQIAMQYMGLFVSVIFSTAQAVTVRMGHQIGAAKLKSANRAAYAGICIALGLILIVVFCDWVLPHWMIRLDFNPHRIHNQEVVHYAVLFFAIAAFFQFFESIRITFFGALRALKDTHFTLVTSIVAFWFVAIPLGYLLSNQLHFGPVGYWVAMAISSVISSVMLFWRYRYIMKQVLEGKRDVNS